MADDFDFQIPETVPGNPGPQLAYRNNNPFNIRYAGQPGAQEGEGGFARFQSPSDAYQEWNRRLSKRQNQTLAEYITEYAPPTENDTRNYIAKASAALGANPGTLISKIPPERLAQFQAQHESGTKMIPADPWKASETTAPQTAGIDPWASNITDPWNTAPGVIPPPGPNTPQRPATWDSSKGMLENIIEQGGEIPERVAENIGGIALSARDIVKNIFHHETPGEVQQKLQGMNQPLSEQLKQLPVVQPLLEGRPGAALGDIASGIMLGRIGRKPLPAQEANLPTLLNVRTPEEVNFLKSSKPLAEIIDSPKGAGRFQDESLRDVMPLVKEESSKYVDTKNGIDSFDKFSGLINKLYEKYTNLYNSYLTPAVHRGAIIDRAAEGIPEAMIRAIPKNIQIDAPAVYQELVEQAKQHGSIVPVRDLDQIRMDNNALLRKFEKATGPDQASILRAQGSTAMLDAEQTATRQALYRRIDPESNGANVAEAQKRLGSLIETKAGLSKLNDSMIRQSDPNFRQKMAKAAVDAYIIKTNPIEGGARVALKRAMAEPDVNGKIKQAFNTYKGKPLQEIPGPSPDVVNGRFTRAQLPPGAIRMGTTDASKVNVTTGEPLAPPLTLKKTGPNTFEWQRNLFPEAPERPVLPKPKRRTNPSSSGHSSGTAPSLEKEPPFDHGT